jgi:hypothetical protein
MPPSPRTAPAAPAPAGTGAAPALPLPGRGRRRARSAIAAPPTARRSPPPADAPWCRRSGRSSSSTRRPPGPPPPCWCRRSRWSGTSGSPPPGSAAWSPRRCAAAAALVIVSAFPACLAPRSRNCAFRLHLPSLGGNRQVS